jgi:hypothetical protein
MVLHRPVELAALIGEVKCYFKSPVTRLVRRTFAQLLHNFGKLLPLSEKYSFGIEGEDLSVSTVSTVASQS